MYYTHTQSNAYPNVTTARHIVQTGSNVPKKFLELLQVFFLLNQLCPPLIRLSDNGFPSMFQSLGFFLLHLLCEFRHASFASLQWPWVGGVKGDRFLSMFGERCRWVCSKIVQERLVGVVEDNFIILPRVNGSHFSGSFERWCLWNLTVRCNCPGMQLQMVVGRDSLFARFLNECYTDLNFEFAPSVDERKNSMSRSSDIVLTLFLTPRMGVSQYLNTHLVPISM